MKECKAMGILKSHSDRQALMRAGTITQHVLDVLGEAAKPGVSTVALETLANRILSEHRSTAPFKGYHGFNHAVCISINEEIVNGPPSRERFLRAGETVSFATAAEHRGVHGKAARTFYVTEENGEPAIPAHIQRLLQGTDAALFACRDAFPEADTLNQLLATVPKIAQIYGLTVIEKMGGAGIGKKLHDYPPTPNTPDDLEEKIPLQVGLCFTIMPMFSLGPNATYHEHADGWTLITNDGALSAHFADTFMVTEQGLINITRPEMNENNPR
jgi:methionyl aminopeptidase